MALAVRANNRRRDVGRPRGEPSAQRPGQTGQNDDPRLACDTCRPLSDRFGARPAADHMTVDQQRAAAKNPPLERKRADDDRRVDYQSPAPVGVSMSFKPAPALASGSFRSLKRSLTSAAVMSVANATPSGVKTL